MYMIMRCYRVTRYILMCVFVYIYSKLYINYMIRLLYTLRYVYIYIMIMRLAMINNRFAS
jgi:hypothetical protein